MKYTLRKFILIFVCMLMLTACGANTDYFISIDETTKAVSLNIDIKVQTSDYQYIDGGKSALIESIDSSMPDIYQFSTSTQQDYDLFNFKADFENFDIFVQYYNSISDNEFSSEIVSIPFSKESLLKSTYSIQLTDSLDVLMDWLVEDLLSSGKIDNTKKDSIIKTSNSYISLSNDTAKKNSSITIEERTEIEQISMLLNIKKDGNIDIAVDFIVKDAYPEFKKYLNDYFKESSDIPFSLNQDNDTFNLVVENLDLKNKETLNSLKNYLGTSFLIIDHAQTIDEKTIKTDISQIISLQFDPYIFLNANEIIPIKIKISYDKNLDHDDLYDVDISEFSQSLSIESSYSTIKTGTIMFMFTGSVLVILIMLIVYRRYKKNKKFKTKVNERLKLIKTQLEKMIKEILIKLKKLSKWIKFKDLNPILSLSNCLLENGNYAININTLSIIKFQKLWNLNKSIVHYTVSSSIIFIALIVHIKWLSLILIILVVTYLIFITIRRDTYILIIQSTCGTEEYLYYSKEIGSKQYLSLTKHIKGENYEN